MYLSKRTIIFSLGGFICMKKYGFVLLISNNIHYHKILFIFNYYIINRYNLYITVIVYFKVIITWVLNEDF